MFCSYAFGNWVTRAIPIFVPKGKIKQKQVLNIFQEFLQKRQTS